MILANFTYKIKQGQREDFVKAAKSIDLLGNTRNENGNISYEYFFPIEDPDAVLCVERWENEEVFAAHRDTDHVVKFQDIKKEYVVDMTPQIYDVNEKS